MPRIPCPKILNAVITLPGDKSLSHRAVMLSAIAKGTTTICNFLDSDDTLVTLNAFKRLGVAIAYDRKNATVIVRGKGKFLKPKARTLALQESGTTIRLIAGLLSGQKFQTTLTAGPLLKKRPMKRITEPLRLMGADIRGRQKGANEYPPLTIRPAKALEGAAHRLKLASAQVKSCLLLAGLYAKGATKVAEPYQSRDHTERMLKSFKAAIAVRPRMTTIRNSTLRSPKRIFIPSDFSSASFFIVLGLLTKGSKFILKRVSINPTRLGLLKVLKRMGAKITLQNIQREGEPYADIVVTSSPLRATTIKVSEVPRMIDELPLVFVVASFAKGVTSFYGLKELQVKEADRVASMEYNLKKMGVAFEVNKYTTPKGTTDVMVKIMGPSRLTKSTLIKSFGDHRTAMSMIIAHLAMGSSARIDDIRCIAKSFPGFLQIVNNLA